GGLKEKVLAAHRAGIRTVLMPVDNEKDVRDIPESVRKEMRLVPVSHMDEVLAEALREEPAPGESPLEPWVAGVHELGDPGYAQEGTHQ
ncbi:S16 family serine protease, partial [Alicyclobacillus sp.]|uniref:S16 family serine protease n=1 Tax=Alicyclobacillus sp. TaxID=61169 RepID=UPI0025B997BD